MFEGSSQGHFFLAFWTSPCKHKCFLTLTCVTPTVPTDCIMTLFYRACISLLPFQSTSETWSALNRGLSFPIRLFTCLRSFFIVLGSNRSQNCELFPVICKNLILCIFNICNSVGKDFWSAIMGTLKSVEILIHKRKVFTWRGLEWQD